eukprot:6982277-Prymnesium_polylepis.1
MRRADELVVVASAPMTREKPHSACIVGAFGVPINSPVSTAAPRVTTQKTALDAAIAALAAASSRISSVSVCARAIAGAVAPSCPGTRSAGQTKRACDTPRRLSCSALASAADGSGVANVVA